MSSPRSLSQALKNVSFDDYPLKRALAQKRRYRGSSSSGSLTGGSSGSGSSMVPSIAYDGPAVKVTDFRSFTAPFPQLPITVVPVLPSPQLEKYRKCRDQATKLLREEKDFDFQSVSVLNLKDASRASPQTTLVVEIGSTEQQDRWEDLTAWIYSILEDESCTELAVHFVAPDPGDNKLIYAVPSDHPWVTKWPAKFRSPVLEALRDYDWEALDVLLYGQSEGRAAPTVFITTRDKSKNDWKRLQGQVTSICEGCQVEVREGRIATRINDRTPTKSDPNQTYQAVVNSGWSIGVEERGAGTMGGYLKLRDPQTQAARIFGLTNYHVVRTYDAPFDKRLDEGPRPWSSKLSQVHSPAQQDFHTEIEHLESQIKDSDREVGSYEHLHAKVSLGIATPSQREIWRRVEARQKRLRDRMARLKALNVPDALSIGNVWMSSGYRKAGDRALDWALVRVEPPRMGANRLPDASELDDDFYINGKTVSEINTDFKEHKDALFFKIGRTTGLTMGKYSHICSNIEMQLPDNFVPGTQDKPYIKQNLDKPDKPYIRYSTEYVMVGLYKQLFSGAGDSGSWIYDRVGALAGMIIGSSGSNATYSTPIGIIVRDIEEQTGNIVELI